MKMSKCFRALWLLALLLGAVPVARAEANPPGLTILLRDGSLIMGTSAETAFAFHSQLLGDLHPAVADVRSLEILSTNSGKITLASGDVLMVSFGDSAVAVKTGFGKIKLPLNQVRSLAVTPAPAVPKLIAFWSGNGDARDSIGAADGTLEGKTDFAPGKGGKAFRFDDEGDGIKIPATASLDVGAGNSFTLTAWINPSDLSGHHPLFEWNPGDGTGWGAHFYIDADSFKAGPGTLYANLSDTAGQWHQIHTAAGAVTNGVFQYVALTYDRSSGLAKIYVNGVLLAQSFVGRFTPQTSYNLFLGSRPPTFGEGYTFSGLLEKAAVYDGALSASDIEAACRKDNAGKLPPPPPCAPRIEPVYPTGFFYRTQ